MRRALAVAVATVALAATACSGGSDGAAPDESTSPAGGEVGVAASCVGPTLSVDPETVRAGDEVTASGEWFAADCYDTGQTGTPPALTDLSLELVQGEKKWLVAAGVDASGERSSFEVPVQLPDELKPGAAHLAVHGYGDAVKLTVEE